MHNIRPAMVKDIPIIVEYRMRMFRSFLGDQYDLEETARFEEKHLAEELEEERFFAWVAEDESGRVIASVGVSFYTLTPKPWNLDGGHAFISSMYTEDKYRRQGIGGQLLDAALAFVREKGIPYATLHASQAGRSLYEKFGFVQTNEMRLKLS